MVKRQFGLVKVRFRGLAKNTAHVVTLFALSNLWMARKQLMAMMGVVRPEPPRRGHSKFGLVQTFARNPACFETTWIAPPDGPSAMLHGW